MNAAHRRLRIALVVRDYNRHIGHSRYGAELATRFKSDHEVHVFANTFEVPSLKQNRRHDQIDIIKAVLSVHFS
jgi:hypothetical protein